MHRAAPRAPSFAVLVLLSAIGPLATDMYLPALPALGADLGAGDVAAQLTLTAFIVGMAAGQVLLGPFSDAAGRRPFVLLGPAVFAATSLACAVAGGAGPFVALRFVQGAAAAAGVVAARAVVSDHYHGPDLARRFGLLSAIGFLAPVVAPVLGTLLLLAGSWRALFVVLAVLGVAQVLGAWAAVPETLPPAQRHPASPRATAARMGGLLADWAFSGHVLVVSLATMGFFSYIGGSSFVLQDVYGISPSGYGAVFAANAAVMAATSAAFTRLVDRHPVVALRRVGLLLATGAAVALAAAALAWPDHRPPLAVVCLLLPVVTAGMGLVIPASITLAQLAGDRARGTAAALNGGLSFSCGAVAMPLTGLLTGAGLLPMAALMAVFLAPALVVSRWAPGPAEGTGPAEGPDGG